jgi:hypothetical protein
MVPHDAGFLRVLLGLAIAIIEGAAMLGFFLLYLIVPWADRYHMMPAIGFLYGASPRAPVAAFAAVGRTLATGTHVVLVSAYQLPRTRGLGNKLWALAPLVFAAGLVVLVVVLVRRVVPALHG